MTNIKPQTRSRKVKVALPLQENMELLKIRYHIELNKNKRFLKQSKKTRHQKKRKRVKPVTYEELDNATYKWLKSARDRNVPVGANVLKLKALEFAKKLDLGNFHASDGWMDQWKKRFNVSFKTISGMFLLTKLESENS